jgi:hypothetical protein
VTGIGYQRHPVVDDFRRPFVNLLAFRHRKGEPFPTGAIANNGIDTHFNLPVDPRFQTIIVNTVVVIQRLNDAPTDARQVFSCPPLGVIFLGAEHGARRR